MTDTTRPSSPACGLHYQKNLVMRPQAMWGDVNVAPRKRRPAKPKGTRAHEMLQQQNEEQQLQPNQNELHQQEHHQMELGTLQMEMDMNMNDRIE